MRTYALASITGTFHLSSKLDFVTIFGGQTNSGYDFDYAGTSLRGISETEGGNARRLHSVSGNWTNEDYFSYKNNFGKHFLNVIAGELVLQPLHFHSGRGAAIFDDYYSYNSLQAGAVTEASTSSPTGNQMNSF